MRLDIIAFGPHPDDTELFCGGTLCLLAENGLKTGVVDLTRGELSTRGNPRQRAEEARAAAHILRLALRENLAIPDGNIANTEANRRKVIEVLRKYRPAGVLIPYWKDRHPDHVNAARLLEEAVFLAGLKKIETGLPAYRPKKTVYYFHHQVATPTFIVDISDTFAQKIEAIKAYKSQFYNPDCGEPETYISSKSFGESIEARAKYFGFQIGAAFGEPFLIKGPLPIKNLSDVFA